MSRRRIVLGLSSAALLLAGCSTGSTWRNDATVAPGAARLNDGSPVRARTTATPDPASAPERRYDRTHHAVDFEDQESMDDSAVRSDRHASLMDIYGELRGGAPGSTAPTGRLDGAGNVRMVTVTSVGGCYQAAVDRRGERLVFASTQHSPTSDIYVKFVDGRTHRQLTKDAAEDMMPAISPDGSMIAFASNRAGNWDIYTMPSDGGPVTQVTNDADDEIHPSFSPDGTQLVYCKRASRSGRWELWLTDLTAGLPRFLAYGLFPEWNPAPNPNRIVFQRARRRGSRLFSVWTLDIVDGEATRETEIVSAANAATMHPTWSPDGKRIAFITVVDPDANGGAPSQSDVYVINRDGTSRMNLTNGQSLNLFPVWSADGNIFFTSDRSGHPNVYAVHTGRTMPLAGWEATAFGESDSP